MKHLTLLCAVALGLTFAAPATVLAGNYRGCSSGGFYRGGGGTAVFVSGSRGFCGPSFRPYCAPVTAFRPSYCAPRWGFYGAPAVSFGFYSAPAFYGSSSYDPGPPRGYYRGVAVGSYRESARYDEDLAVDVQRALARRGYYRGEIDGDVGPGTRAAIRSYQYNRGFEVTGRIDNSLLRSLGLS